MRSLILLFPITAIFLIDPNDSAAQQNKQDTASTLTPTQTPPPAAAKGGFSTNWGKWGFPLFPPEFKATPGLSLFFHQTKKDVFQYGLVAVGLPADKTYRLWQKKLDASQPTRFPPELGIKIVSDNTGYVISRADGNVFLIATATFLKGEALQIALTSEDKTVVAFAKTIPNPIESIQGPYRTGLSSVQLEGMDSLSGAKVSSRMRRLLQPRFLRARFGDQKSRQILRADS